MQRRDFDDLDDLLAGATPAPPPEMEARLHRRVQVERRAGRLLMAVCGDVVAVCALVVLSLSLGRALAAGGAHDLLTIAIRDPSIVRAGAGEYFTALMQTFPWRQVVAVALDLLAVVLLTGYVAREVVPAPAPHGALL